MAVSSTPSTPLAINTIILLAYKRAGVLPVEATTSGANMTAKLSHGKTLLDLILNNLVVEGFNARLQDFYDLSVVASTASYTLTDTVYDVIESGMFKATGETTELVVNQIDLATWQTLTDKTTEGSKPQLYVVFRDGATPVVQLWPVPTEAGTLRLKVIRLLGDNSTGTNSTDLQRYWEDALVWLLAAVIAVDSSMPTDRVMMLQSMAEQKKRACLRYNFEHTPTQAVVSYMTQWST